MKFILLATSAVALTAGFASAEVTLSGDARMGIISGFDLALADDPLTAGVDESLIDESDLQFTSRARVKFTLSGSTDSGLEFGASFRADNAVGASAGTAGSVFISGAFGKLSMGDVDGAANAAVGQVSGVGLTGLGDLNEVTYIANGGATNGGFGSQDDPSALYEYSTGDLTIYASATNPSGVSDAYAIAAKYVIGDYAVSLGYEDQRLVGGFKETQLLLGATASFGSATVKAVYGNIGYNDGSADQKQMAVSVDYVVDALTVTGFYMDSEDAAPSIFGGERAYGLGAAYDLGGGASVVGGYVKNQTTDQDAYDLGVSMSF